MDQYSGSGAYRAAVEVATEELDQLFQEANRLRDRMEQLESVVAVLEPMMNLGEVEQPRYSFETLAPAPAKVNAEAHSEPVFGVELSQPVVQPVAQAWQESADPIQARIDSMLRLAVA